MPDRVLRRKGVLVSDDEPADASGSMELATAIGVLRNQLLDAQRAGTGRAVSFGVGKVEVEFSVEARTTAGGQAGMRFWVVSADARVDHSRASTHKVKLELIPTDTDGAPIRVAGSSVHGPPPE